MLTVKIGIIKGWLGEKSEEDGVSSGHIGFSEHLYVETTSRCEIQIPTQN